MKLPASLTRKIGGVPAWAWALTLALFLAYVIWKRRQGEAEEEFDEPIDEGLSPTAELSGLGGYVGGGDQGFAFLDAIDALADYIGDSTATVVDRIDNSQSSIEERIDTVGEQTAALITDGYQPEPAPAMPSAPAPDGSDNGSGNGQLPPVAPTPAPTITAPAPSTPPPAMFPTAPYNPLPSVPNPYVPAGHVRLTLPDGGVYSGPALSATERYFLLHPKK